MIGFNARSTWTIYQQEVLRAFRTALQSIIAPVLTTSLYFVVFGAAVGGQMQSGMGGVNYGAFIVPGLLLLTLLSESTQNASFGIYMPRFTGAIEQVPPAYSALKIDGERAYDLARAGENVVLASRAVTIHSLTIAPGASTALDKNGLPAITLVVQVSKGTYIRSLARDIALALGTCGHVTYLRRTRAGPFMLDRAISLDNLNAIGKGSPLEPSLLPLEAGLDDIPALDLGPEEARAVRQGRVLSGLSLTDGQYWARSGGIPLALIELAGGEGRVVRGFNLSDVAE